MIKIFLNDDDFSDEAIALTVPKVLACAVSTGFQRLVKHRLPHTLPKLLGGLSDYEDFDAVCILGCAPAYLSCFIRWLYTSQLRFNEELSIWELWRFAELIGCFKLQNAALSTLGYDAAWQRTAADIVKQQQFGFIKRHVLLTVWGETDFSKDCQHRCFAQQGNVYWEDKKRLLFLLDCLVWMGEDSEDVISTLVTGKGMAVQMARRMVFAAKEGGDQCP